MGESRVGVSYRVTGGTRGKGIGVLRHGDTRIVFDSGAGRDEQWAGPAELLCGALAACLLKNLSRMGDLLAFRWERAEVEVEAVREEKPPRIVEMRYVLRVATEETDHRLALLQRNVEAHGTIFQTLAAACAVRGEVVRL